MTLSPEKVTFEFSYTTLMIGAASSFAEYTRVATNRPWLICAAHIAASLLILISPSNSFAELSGEDKSVLSRSLSPTWYDAESGSFAKAEEVAPPEVVDVSDRYTNVITAPKPSNTVSSPSSASSRFRSPSYQFFLSLFQNVTTNILIIVIMILLILTIVYFMGGFSDVRINKRSSSASKGKSTPPARITDLPFELSPSELNFLEQADLYRSHGDSSKAIIYYFSHLLIELDSAGLIRLERGKTNQTYIRELRQHSNLKQHVSSAVRWFEQVFFGRQPIGAPEFDSLRSQLADFETWMQLAKRESTERNSL